MESYGELLKKARESKNIDFETVSRNTTISVSFLKGLEDEDNGAFPSEAYMLGFLRNYSDFLGLETETLLALYRSKKLQESPVPDGLIVHEKPVFFWPILITGIIVLVCGLTFCGWFIYQHNKSHEDAEVIVDKNTANRKFELNEKSLNERLYIGDQLVYPAKEGDIVLTVSDTLSAFGLQCPVGTLYTELAEEAEIDIDGDAVSDLIVYVSDVSVSDSSRGAEVRIVKRSGGSYISSVNQEDIPFASDVVSGHKRIVVFEDNRAYPIALNCSFRGSCVFRYKVDRHDPVEAYYSNGEVITMTANNGIRLWMSNCNTVKFSMIADSRNYDLEIGKAGQVLVEDIKWVKDKATGKYMVVVEELD